MKRFFFLAFVIVVFVFLAACGPKKSASHLETIQKNGVMKVGTSRGAVTTCLPDHGSPDCAARSLEMAS